MSRRQQMDWLMAVLCGLLCLALLRHYDGLLGPARQELANDQAQQQRHLDRLERHAPGALAQMKERR